MSENTETQEEKDIELMGLKLNKSVCSFVDTLPCCFASSFVRAACQGRSITTFIKKTVQQNGIE